MKTVEPCSKESIGFLSYLHYLTGVMLNNYFPEILQLELKRFMTSFGKKVKVFKHIAKNKFQCTDYDQIQQLVLLLIDENALGKQSVIGKSATKEINELRDALAWRDVLVFEERFYVNEEGFNQFNFFGFLIFDDKKFGCFRFFSRHQKITRTEISGLLTEKSKAIIRLGCKDPSERHLQLTVTFYPVP